MLPLSSLASECLFGTHGVTYRASVTSASFGTLSGLAVSGGSINEDASGQNRKSGTIYLADISLWPENPTDVLSPIDAQMTVEQGIVLPTGAIEWIPLMVATVSQADDSKPVDSNGLVITLDDLAQKIHDDQFEQATTFGGTGKTMVGVITQLIQRTYPNATIQDLSGDHTSCPAFQVQNDPWSEGVEVLATSIGCEVFCNSFGVWIIRKIPTLDATAPVVWTVQTGPKGNLAKIQRTQARAPIYNTVVVTAAGSSSSTPITVTVRDTDPNSPTNVNGPFGRKPFTYQAPLATSSAQCTTIGKALLAMSQGAGYTAQLSIIPNPALATGDVIRSLDGDSNRALIIDSISNTLDSGTPQTVVGRTTEIGDISQTGI